MPFFRLLAAVFSLGTAISFSTAAQAAVLDIGTDACASVCGNGGSIVDGYGDMAGLDVTFESSGGGAMFYWGQGYSALSGVAYASSDQIARITLAPEAGYKLTLKGFQLGAWQGIPRTTSYRIYNGRGTLLLDSGGIFLPAEGLDVAGKWRGKKGIVIEFGPDAFNVGIDMILFKLTQVTAPLSTALAMDGSGPQRSGPPVPAPQVPAVPVPASLPMLAAAVLALALLRRRFARA